MKTAESAYGAVVARELDVGLSRFADPNRRRRCVETLGIADPRTLARGLRVLKNHLKGAMTGRPQSPRQPDAPLAADPPGGARSPA